MGSGEGRPHIRHILAVGVTIVLLLALVAAGSWWSAGRIQDDLSRRARAALVATGIGTPVHLTGRDATLTGTVSSAEAARTADVVVADLWGIGQVTSHIAVVAPAPSLPPGSGVPVPNVWPEGSVGFASGLDILAPSAQKYLNSVAEYLQATPLIHVVIEGNSDNVGPEALNRDLSQRRSDVVAAYLVSRGVGADRLHTVSYADTRPVASNGNAAGRSVNRRVALVFEETD